MMNLGDTIRSGVKWVVAGKVGHEMLHFALSIVLARLLTPSDFGLLVTVQIFTGLAGFVAGGGMGQALIQARTMNQRDTHVVFTAQLAIGVLLYTCFYLVAPWFAAWFDEPLYEDLLRVSALTFIIRAFANVPNSLLGRAMRYRARAGISIANLVISGTTSVVLAILGYGVWSLVLGGIAGGLSNVLLANRIARWSPRLALDTPTLRRLAGYGLQVSANDMVGYLREQSANFVISRFIGTAAVGLYNKSFSLNQTPRLIIGGSTYLVVFRALSKVQDNLDQSRYIYLRTITLVTVYALPVYVGFWWVAEPFIVTVYGARWAEAAPVLEILATAGIFHLIGNQCGAVSAARKLLGKELNIQILTWMIFIVAIWIGHYWGITGVAWAAVAAAIPSCLMMVRLASRELKVRYRDIVLALRPALILNGILFATLWLADTLLLSEYRNANAVYLVSMAALGALVYSTCFLYLPISQLGKEADRWKHRLRLPIHRIDK